VRIALVVLMSLISFSTFARETVVVAFANGDVEFSAKISNDNEEAGFHIKKLVIRIPGASHGKLRLVSEFGWDDKPYNFICEKFSRALYGDDRFKFSTAYGYATATGGLGNLFTREEFLSSIEIRPLKCQTLTRMQSMTQSLAATKESFYIKARLSFRSLPTAAK
jgi:hypothetical protein